MPPVYFKRGNHSYPETAIRFNLTYLGTSMIYNSDPRSSLRSRVSQKVTETCWCIQYNKLFCGLFRIGSYSNNNIPCLDTTSPGEKQFRSLRINLSIKTAYMVLSNMFPSGLGYCSSRALPTVLIGALLGLTTVSFLSSASNMRQLLLLVLLAGVVAYLEAAGTTCNCGWVNKGRIVGGKETKKNEYPLVVALLDREKNQICGGTILTPWHVATAGHCADGVRPTDISVAVGVHNIHQVTSLYEVAKIIVHEKYDEDKAINDIALLVTRKQLSFNQNVGPACLPTRRLNLVGQKVKALGWGDMKDGGSPASSLREVDLQVISFERCAETWKGHELVPRRETNMCTFEIKKDTCQGDSGGPLVWLDPSTNRYTLAAIVSYGGVCGGNQAAPNTDVSAFLPWINRNIQASKPGVKACIKA